ncbi:MAG: GntR family transcriptional regulator [Pseudomonadota bacterium]
MSTLETTTQGEPGADGTVELTPLSSYDGTLAHRVYASLKDAILSLTYQPGQMLRKGDICNQLGISRSPVAEAVTRLAAEGLVDVIPQAGTFAARFSMDEIREGAFLREALELAAVERLAAVVSDDQIKVLRRNLRVQKACIEDLDVQAFYALDSEMHRLILGFTGYRRLAAIAETSWLQVNRARQLILPNQERVEETLREHTRIIDALEARDPDQARHMTQTHLRQLLPNIEAIEQVRPELFSGRG